MAPRSALTSSKVGILEVGAPCRKSMIEAPSRSGRTIPTLDFQSVAKLVELAAWPGGDL